MSSNRSSAENTLPSTQQTKAVPGQKWHHIYAHPYQAPRPITIQSLCKHMQSCKTLTWSPGLAQIYLIHLWLKGFGGGKKCQLFNPRHFSAL